MAKGYSYIQQMQDQRGEAWIMTLKPEEIQNSAKRIVKDMVKGSIDYDNLGYAFKDSKFLENLSIGVSNELQVNTLYYNACVEYRSKYPLYPNITASITHLEKLINIYTIIINKLYMVKSTGNIGYLVDIAPLLYNDRFHLN